MTPFKPDTILIVVSSPVDLLTSLALKLSQLPPSQVLGSGTYLDSVRLRGMLADKIGVSVIICIRGRGTLMIPLGCGQID